MGTARATATTSQGPPGVRTTIGTTTFSPIALLPELLLPYAFLLRFMG